MAAVTRVSGWAASIASCMVLFACSGPSEGEPDSVKAAAQSDQVGARLMLEWGRPVHYTVMEFPPYIVVRFSYPFRVDLEAAQRSLSHYLTELRLAGRGRVLVLRVTGQPHFTHYRRGNAIILSWVGAGRATQAEKSPNTKTPPRTPPMASRTRPAKPRPGAAPESKPESPPPKLRSGPGAAPDSKPEVPLPKPAPRAAPDTKPEAPPPNAAAPPSAAPTLTVATAGAETHIAVAWPDAVGVAVFRYGGTVWMIFPRREAFDVTGIQSPLGPGVESLRRIEHPGATVLAVRAQPDVRASVLHEGNVWTLVLRRESGAGRESEAKKVSILRRTREEVAVALLGAEAPIRLVDSEIGSTIHVVPSREPAAVGEDRRFVTFRLVPAAQGAVIEELADGLMVGDEGDAIIIHRKGGLLLSDDIPAGSEQQGQ